MQVKPFKINVPQAVLDDLAERLAETRWAAKVEGVETWDYGADFDFMKDLVGYWQNGYDWRKQEAALNLFAHFTAEVNGINIHFIHERGRGPNPTPILLTHGWPDSFYRFHKLIPMLTDPAKFGGDPNLSFDVIVPDIPGFGFSERKAMSQKKIANLWVKLMAGLGYEQFAAAGGDIGGGVTANLAYFHPESLIAAHYTDVGYPDFSGDMSDYSPAEQEFAGFIGQWWMSEGAYSMQHMTKPQTLAYGLNDSPAGLAGWIINFFSLKGATERKIPFSKDELLTNIMIYWVTETIGSSIRTYYEGAHEEEALQAGSRSDVPAAVAHAQDDAPLPRDWAERNVNLKQFTEFPNTGHFAAWQQPELFAQDLWKFFASLRVNA
jgi:pimeloyl-ACP methyl ester carboxylesterase